MSKIIDSIINGSLVLGEQSSVAYQGKLYRGKSGTEELKKIFAGKQPKPETEKGEKTVTEKVENNEAPEEKASKKTTRSK